MSKKRNIPVHETSRHEIQRGGGVGVRGLRCRHSIAARFLRPLVRVREATFAAASIHRQRDVKFVSIETVRALMSRVTVFAFLRLWIFHRIFLARPAFVRNRGWRLSKIQCMALTLLGDLFIR